MMQRQTAPILVDQFGRQKRKLRISVTDRCNFKCVYCMPEHPEWVKKHLLLSFEALLKFCDLMVSQGIEHIRITGGEPLMRQGVVHFIADLNRLKAKGLKRISMTTNAHYLKKYALALQQAGLDDVNISLDSLSNEQFYKITQKALQPVLDGIHFAQQINLPIKINAVLIKGENDDQILPLMQWSMQHNIPLRFIEFMPLDGDRQWSAQHVVSEQDILETLARQFEIKSCTQNHDPARLYTANGQVFGIISTITHAFCGSCDRLRLTAKGELYNCLFATQSLNLKPWLMPNVTEDISNAEEKAQDFLTNIQDYIWQKKAGFHAIQQQAKSRKISMHMLGG